VSESIEHLGLRDGARVQTLQVVVREETPFLPKVAFVLISLASLGGAVFTGLGLGVAPAGLGLRWLTLWSIALAGGFLLWRLVYLRSREPGVDQAPLEALNHTALARADRVARVVAVSVFAGAAGAFVVPHLEGAPLQRGLLVAGSLALAALLALGVQGRGATTAAVTVVALLLLGWSATDAGTGWPLLLRVLHLSAFTLWLGGALWNIAVAMPAGRQHANVPAVLAGAKQLDRFRWVVRFALPTIIITGLVMAGGFRSLGLDWWTSFPGVLIPLKVLAIVALVVVFITCPLFRHCSPVQGVCNVEDLDHSDRPAP